ncbi:hypothetical protein B0H16DRAFT_1455708 [Mycena metata]|uniref:Uncharacterized protein n=1 Tax=Mycena metata TaxID=1033252 RepID=A0AAD7JDF7_9AGAR|nr:hypothetical protein B0H16DRAFT_1455708 [Mycena metata]
MYARGRPPHWEASVAGATAHGVEEVMEYIANPTPRHGVSNVRKSDTFQNSRTWIGKTDTPALLGYVSQKIRHLVQKARHVRGLAWDRVTVDAAPTSPASAHIPAAPTPRPAMTALEALLTRLPDTVLEQFRDAARSSMFHLMHSDIMSQSFPANFRRNNTQLFSGTSWVGLDDLLAWLRQRGDMDHLLASDSNFPFDPRSVHGTDIFNGYADETRSATPSSSYSYPNALWGAITIRLSDDPIRMIFDQSSRNTVGGKTVILSPPRPSPGRFELPRIKKSPEAWPCLASHQIGSNSLSSCHLA